MGSVIMHTLNNVFDHIAAVAKKVPPKQSFNRTLSHINATSCVLLYEYPRHWHF